jgi:hypothetical protein
VFYIVCRKVTVRKERRQGRFGAVRNSTETQRVGRAH